MKRPAPVSDLLGAFLRGTPAEKRLSEGRIWLVWDEAVGARIALHAQPAAFRDGTLTLSVDSAPWMQQLTYLKRELISKVNEALDEDLVQEIYMKAGQIRKPAVSTAAPRKRRELSAEELALIKEQAESVTDPELRAVFERLIKRDRENRD
jgi:predicted nucleic acid-binding Zn ribbon protein